MGTSLAVRKSAKRVSKDIWRLGKEEKCHPAKMQLILWRHRKSQFEGRNAGDRYGR